MSATTFFLAAILAATGVFPIALGTAPPTVAMGPSRKEARKPPAPTGNSTGTPGALSPADSTPAAADSASASSSSAKGVPPATNPFSPVEGFPDSDVLETRRSSRILDDPEARQEWLQRQRAYPSARVPARAYADAAVEYLRRREEVRWRHIRMHESQPTGSSAIPPGSGSLTSERTVAGRIEAERTDAGRIDRDRDAAGGLPRNDPGTTVTGKTGAGRSGSIVSASLSARTGEGSALEEGEILGGGSLTPEALPSGPWSEIGPSPITDDGTQTGHVYGNPTGRISAVALHPTDPNVILVGASRGGIWRSADNGASWTPVSDDQATLVIADIKYAPSNPSIAYAATGDDDVNYWGAGVLKSLDGGLTWSRVDDGTEVSGIPDGTVLSKLAVDSKDPDRVVIAGYRELTPDGRTLGSYIFRTVDGGTSWSRAILPTAGNVSQFRSLVIEPGCPSRLWAIDYVAHSLVHSEDGGASWTTVTTTGLPSFALNTKIAVYHPTCLGPATLYASVQSGGGLAGSNAYPGVYRSIDDGATWQVPGLAAGPSSGCLRQCQYDHELFVDPADPTRVYMLGQDVWTSADAGATWVNRSGGYDDANTFHGGRMHVDQHDAAIRGASASAVIYIASDGGLWSYDVLSDSFTNRNGNLAIAEFTHIFPDPDTPNRAIGGLQDNGTIQYLGGDFWAARVTGDGGHGGYLKGSDLDGNTFKGAFTSSAGNYAFISTDSGATWSDKGEWASNASFPRPPGSSFPFEAAELYAPWVSAPGSTRIWHGAQSLWYCDFPATCAVWNKQADNLAGMTGSSDVSKIAVASSAPGVYGPFYVANFNARAFLQSPDGVSWNNRSAGLPERYISDIEFNPASPEQVWVTVKGFGSAHVLFSPDGGATWEDRSGNLPNIPANDLLLDPLDVTSTWYVATDIGVYGTTDGGANWSVIGSNLPVVWVNSLGLGPNRMLYAGTGGRSAWRIALPGSVPPPAEVSGAMPLLLSKSEGALLLSWEDMKLSSPRSYNVYQGTLGSWYSHRSVACHLDATDLDCSDARCTVQMATGTGSRYFLITTSGQGSESPASDGPGWSGPDHHGTPPYAAPEPCGGY